MKGLLKIADCVFSTAAALAVAWSALLTGCDMDSREGCSPYPRELNVTLPALTVADAVVVEPMGSRSAVSVEDDALFSVGLGPERGADASWERSLSTRADVTLSNVWVLQFDASGATKACAYVGTVAAGRKVQATLQSGENYTVWIVANGPAEGVLTTLNPATLSDFENKMLHTAAAASDETIPLTGGLSGVRILDNGQVLVGTDNTVVPEMTLTRAMARVDVLLEYDVDGADLDGVWLYQVPAGACYGLDDAVTDYPASGTVSNFAYRNGDTSGLVPTSSGSGTVTHTWYIGDNRRGQNPVIQWEKNKGSNNAPAMATYARIKSHESSDTAKGLFHDVYLGENVTTDFNVLRNRHYIYRVRIGGTLDDQKLLAERDDRVWAGTLEYLDGAPTVDPDLSLPIHVNGQTMRVTFSGYWTGPGIPVRATVVGGEELASGIAACYVGNTGSAMLEIPKNEGGAERQIEFAYEWKGEWNVIGIGTQAGYGVTGAKVTPEGDIPGAGGSYVVTLNGAWEEFVKVRAWDGSKSLVNVTVLTPGADVNFSVPVNESFDSRTVTFQYQWGDEWITIGEPRTQASGVIDTGGGNTIIEPDPNRTGTWQEAIDYCSGKGDGWRLPTENELYYYWYVEPSVSAVSPFMEGDYWSSTNNASDSGQAWTFDFKYDGGIANKKGKTERLYMRCVRDKESGAGTEYPYVKAEGNSSVVVLRDAAGGIDRASLFASRPTVTVKDGQHGENNRMSAMLQVQNTQPSDLNWRPSIDYCDNLVEEGYDDWRLPTQRELMLIWTVGGNEHVGSLDIDNSSASPIQRPIGNSRLHSLAGFTVLPDNVLFSATWSEGEPDVWPDIKWILRISGTDGRVNFEGVDGDHPRSFRCVRDWDGSAPNYTVSETAVTPAGDIPGEGKTYSLTLTGDLPPAGVEVRAQSGGTALATGKVTASGTAVDLAVPGNASYSSRSVTFEYNWNGTWTKISDARTQQGWNVTAASVSPEGNIPQAGGTYTVTLTGWGGFPIRAIDGDGNELAINTEYEEVANYSASILIPANTGTEARSVTLQYSQEGVWNDIETRIQLGLSYVTNINWADCNTRCSTRGGLPTSSMVKSMDWSSYPIYAEGGGVMYYWCAEKNMGPIGTARVYIVWSQALHDKDQGTVSDDVGCRCVND